jgi:hypothetical protein
MTPQELLAANERFPHRAHQLEGVHALLKHPAFGLFDEVGAGKSKQIVDTAQILFVQGKVDTVVVITPGFARSTWAEEDPTLGEVAKHAWENIPNVIHEFHKHYTDLHFHPNSLNWVVSNYEFIRRDSRLADLMDALRGRRTWLVLDESWAIKGFSDQMRACRQLRVRRADRVTLLNGTPLSDGKPIDLFYPMTLLDPNILGITSKGHFESRYCIMGGPHMKQVVRYQNLDDFNQRIAPYVLSRRTRDCFDLPPMLDPILIEARLTPATWKVYTAMRDELVAWCGSQVSTAKQAIVKALRLAQITSGYLGGLEDLDDDGTMPDYEAGYTEPTNAPVPQWLRDTNRAAASLPEQPPSMKKVSTSGDVTTTREIGREKLDAFMHWLDVQPQAPHKLLVWCRFKPELTRMQKELESVYKQVHTLRGGQSKDERRAAKHALAPGGDPTQAAVVGNQKAGGASLNFSAASTAVYMSNGPALIERTQSIGRIERPGQQSPMQIIDVVAVGPKGQKTIDHAILKALRSKDDMARWTVDQWRKILRES